MTATAKLTAAQAEALRRGISWDSRTGDALVLRGLMEMETDCGRRFYMLTDRGVAVRRGLEGPSDA